MYVTVEYKTTFARMYPFGKCLLAVFTALKASTRRAVWGNLHESPPSLCRFGSENREELGPRSVLNRLSHATGSIGDHLRRREIFDRNQTILGYDPMSQLVLKVFTLIRYLCMKARHAEPRLLATLGASLLLGQLALRVPEPPLGLPIPAGVVDLLPGRERNEVVNPHVYANFTSCGWIGASGHLVARKDRIPVSGFSLDRYRLDLALNLSVEFDLDEADILDVEPLRELNAVSIRRECNRIEAVGTFEARISGCFASLDTPEETVERLLEPAEYVLTSRVVQEFKLLIGITSFFELRGLIKVSDRDLVAGPHPAALFERGVVEPTRPGQEIVQSNLLRLGGIQAVLEGAAHLSSLVLDICFHGLLTDMSYCTCVIRTGPQRGKTGLDPRELFPKFMGREPFESIDDLGYAPPGIAFHEQMNVIGHDFKRMNLHFELTGLLVEKNSKAFPNRAVKNGSSVFRAPHDVVLERKDGPSIFPVSGVHMMKYTIGNNLIQERRRGAIPPSP